MPDPLFDAPQDPKLDGMRCLASYAPGDDEAHGRAALLLVESLIHALVDKALITQGEAIDLIDIASEVEADFGRAYDGSGEMAASLLEPLAKTFRI